MASPTAPVLELWTEHPHDYVEIAERPGTRYELALPGDLSLMARSRHRRLWARALELEDLEEPTPAEEAEYLRITRELAASVLPTIPGETLDQLGPMQQQAVFVSFLALATRTSPSYLAMVMTAAARGIAATTSSPESSPTSPTTTPGPAPSTGGPRSRAG